MLYRIAAGTLAITGAIILLFFRRYNGTVIPHPWLFVVLAFGLFIAAYFLARQDFLSRYKKASKQLHSTISHLIDNGERIKVKFSQCEIHDQASDTPASMIVFKHTDPRTGRTERFISSLIPKDRLSLSVYLDQQVRTWLYVDKNNRTLYYFDLRFLSAT